MNYINITHDKKKTYTLKENEQCVFFLLNRSGAITFELAGAGAEAHIFAFFVGRDADAFTLTINQRHTAPHTVSHTLVKSVLSQASALTYNGLIHIGKAAVQSDTSQESRTILLSPDAKASAEPTLEILANDVRCRHAATTAPLNQETLFFAESRGLSKAQATTLLINGFFNEALEKIQTLDSSFQFPVFNFQSMYNESISKKIIIDDLKIQ